MPGAAQNEPLDGEVGVAVVGAGYWGPNLVRNFMACPRTWLWTVCDIDLDRARQVVGRRSSITVTSSIDEVLGDPRIEAVAIATPAATHFELAMAAIGAGKHILVEKPLALSSREARIIARAADDAGLVAMCDHTYYRYTPAVSRIRSEDPGGQPRSRSSTSIPSGSIWASSSAYIDVFWDLLPHDFSILDSVLGPSFSPLAVSAVGVDPVGAGKACVGYATLLLPNDAIAHTHVSWLSPVKIRNVVFGGSTTPPDLGRQTNPGLRIATLRPWRGGGGGSRLRRAP